MDNTELTHGGRFAVLAVILLVLFVGIIPIALDLRGMPRGKSAVPQTAPAIKSWPLWPDNVPGVPADRRADGTVAPESAAGFAQSYHQIAGFANRSAYAMAALEQTISDAKTGRASASMVYHAATAESAAAEDERDALMGFVVPPDLRSNQTLLQTLKLAQLAALAKIHAMEMLESSASGDAAWNDPAYLRSLREARMATIRAIEAARGSVSLRSV